MIHLLPPALTREAHLVVQCARTTVDPSGVTRIRQLAQDSLNWGRIGAMAKWHGVAPLVYRTLSRYCPDMVLPTVLEDLKQNYQACALLSHSLGKDLIDLHRAFSKKGIAVLPFKGLSVAVAAYGDMAARECGDIDFIIRKSDISRAREILLSEGYEDAIDASAHETDPDKPFHLYINRARAVTVDLQWVMADGTFSFRLDQPQFWNRLKPLTMGGVEIPTLSPEDHLLVLCAHGSKHVFEQLKWICDVAELVRAHRSIDWSYLEATAKNLHCWRLVLMGLALSRTFFAVPLPAGVHQAIAADPDVPGLARRMPKNLLASARDGLGQEDCEPFLFTVKDTRWEQWWHGLVLCRDRSPSLAADYTWSPSWKTLQRLYAAIHLFQRIFRRLVPSIDIRRRVGRWLLPAQ